MIEDDADSSNCERLISGDITGEIPELPGATIVSPVDIDLQFISIELANVASTLSSIYATINAQIAGTIGEIRSDLRTVQELLRESVRETIRESESCCVDIRRELALAVTFEIQSLYENLAQFGIQPPTESPLADIVQSISETPEPQQQEPAGAKPVSKDEELAAECPPPIGVEGFELCEWKYPQDYDTMARIRDSGFATFRLPPFEFTSPG